MYVKDMFTKPMHSIPKMVLRWSTKSGGPNSFVGGEEFLLEKTAGKHISIIIIYYIYIYIFFIYSLL